ncbi:MAG: maleylpyruvate isomerase family mycothiol-dependent enzyme [Ilumatobacter sp.]|uniref:maleylpyruvate isomerase family mycothiol-dependent enzyme n=1 Tax=Ilumatobacter sp. TaxID=1967498 RepID=UPI00262EF433|nr:maleylpyruvate isomerase family mycothiol-dependent enzyme [Ilumatobacter sp.]MDJ0767649.1 maleylpyruvate isomerase family mycothiol-dependent enzyme [Ilumatobacter sp.]
MGGKSSGARTNAAEVEGESGDVRGHIASCRASHAALVGHLRELTDVDPAAPSRLLGWSIGHVLTHIARNADGHVSMLDGCPQYPHGPEGRTADIERGAVRPWPELVDDVATSAAALERRWATHGDWDGTSRMLSGERPTGQLPLLRQREVEVHRVDLGLGYELGDMPADYVRRDLRLMGMLWTARQPMGMTPLPDAVLRLAPSERLGWMMGRLDLDGVRPAGLF